MSLFAAVAVLSAATAVYGGGRQECFTRVFGDFADGLAVWQIATSPIERGDAGAAATVEVVDASGHKSLAGGFPFDSATLQISVSAVAGLASGAGSAQSSVQMSMIVASFGDTLRFEAGGAFEHQFLGGAGHGIEVAVDVDGAGGGHVSHVLRSDLTPAAESCGFSLSILGTLDDDPATISIDMESAGILWGEYIIITIRARAIAEATLPCQAAISDAILLLDNLRICQKFSPYDLNEDGAVNGLDLAILLGQWGACPVCLIGPCPCEADFDFTGIVNGQDLAMLLGAWGAVPVRPEA